MSNPDLNQEASNKKKTGRKLIIVAILMLIVGVIATLAVRYYVHPEKVILVLHGSTSVGEELAPKLAESFLRENRKATHTGINVVGKDSDGHPRVRVWGDVPGDLFREVIEIYAAGSGDAFKCLATEQGPDHCDIGMSSRPMNDQDQSKFPVLESMHNTKNEHVIALDGIAVVVNPQNAVSQLSMEQLKAIYTGQITNWKDVGGADVAIEIYGRDQKSGTGEMFAQMVIGKDAQGHTLSTTVPKSHQLENGSSIVKAVMDHPYAIGYTSSPLVKDSKSLAISDATGTALLPSDLAIVTEDYPITRRLFLYHKTSPTEMIREFIDFTIHENGQKAVTEAHYVALTPKTYNVEQVPIDSPAQYKEFAAKYNKLGLSFRFSSGKIETFGDQQVSLDNLAQDNVNRLQEYLILHPKARSQFLLIGYSDNTGVPDTNYLLGLARANNVKNSLEAYDVRIAADHVFSFGAEMPVASNSTAAGRNLNRRVEIWVPKNVD